jgi:hypothetical protein
LQQALKAQDRNYDAGFVEEQFRKQWKGEAEGLKIEDLA